MMSFRYLIIVDFKILINIKGTKCVYRKQNCRRVANFMSQCLDTMRAQHGPLIVKGLQYSHSLWKPDL